MISVFVCYGDYDYECGPPDAVFVDENDAVEYCKRWTYETYKEFEMNEATIRSDTGA